MKDVIKDNLYTIVQTMIVFFLGMGLGAALMDAVKDWISEKERRSEMRRCYYCGAKKRDDMILCEKCAKELEERLKEKKDDKRTSENRTNVDIRGTIE